MVALTRVDDIFELQLGDGDVRFTPDALVDINAALDEVAAHTGPGALITTASGKIWHNGLDLENALALGDGFGAYVHQVHQVFGRFLSLPVPTVAAIGGHAFAAGAMLALAHDQRVMRADRGYFCLPEVTLGIPFSEPMAALIAAKLSQPALHRIAVLGERVPGPTAVEWGVVDAVADDADAVVAQARQRAAALTALASPTLPRLRANFYGSAIELLS